MREIIRKSKQLHTLLEINEKYLQSLTMGFLVSITAIAIHSLGDFNLQIPANVLLFWIILALSSSIGIMARSEEERPSQSLKKRRCNLTMARRICYTTIFSDLNRAYFEFLYPDLSGSRIIKNRRALQRLGGGG